MNMAGGITSDESDLQDTVDKVSIHSTASHLNTYVPGSVRGVKLEEADV